MVKIRLLLLKAVALITILSVSFVSTILIHLASRTVDFHNLRHELLLGNHVHVSDSLKDSLGERANASYLASVDDATAGIVKTARQLASRSNQPFILVLHASIGMLSQIKSWLCNTATFKDVHRNTLIITDGPGYVQLSDFVSSSRFPVTIAKDSLPSYLQSDQGYPFQTLGYWRTTQNRVRVLSAIANGGVAFMNVEPDAVWASSIYEQEELVGDDMGDDLVGIAGGPLARKTMCFGFLRLKNSTSVQTLMEAIVQKVDEELGPMDENENTMKIIDQRTIRGEQHYLNRLLREEKEDAVAASTGSIHKIPLRSRMLERCAYPTGLWYDGGIFGDGADFRQKCRESGTGVVVLQNNVAKGNACKVIRLKRWDHWFLDDDESKCLDHQSSLEKAWKSLQEGRPNGNPTDEEANGQCSGYEQERAPKINIRKNKHVMSADIRPFGPPPEGRFPDGGTAKFDEQCPWTSTSLLSDDQNLPKCTIFLRPVPTENEGIALWVSQMAMGYMIAVQAKCSFLFDYGEGVKIHEVIQPVSQSVDWRVPAGFDCEREENCFRLGRAGQVASYNFTDHLPGRDNSIAPVPFYRFALWRGTHTPFYESSFRALEASISKWNIRRGFGCSLGKLFTFSQQASKYEPKLFTEILPALRDETAAVVAIYIRTSQADVGADSSIDEESLRETAKGYTRRGQMLEQILLMKLGINHQHKRDIRSVTWLVVTDSVYLKSHIKSSFGGRDANALVAKPMQKFPGRVIPRRVIYTQSRGLHSKAKNKGGTDVFAESMIDWYLIGESDIVVTGPFTYGHTASLRTSRPVYDYNDGKELQLIRPGDPPAGGEVQKAGEAVKGQVVMVDGKPFNVDGCTLDNGMWLCTGKMGQDNSTKPK